jgi:N-acetylglucosaminyl-diphospho-decaprenol L-rhamnosyltransferase
MYSAKHRSAIKDSSMNPPIVIAIVSWNTRELLDACLESMRHDAGRGLAEVWVVDNGSSDGSPELVRTRHPWATLLEPERNLGFGSAVNLVAARTSSPWIAPANADIELIAGSLDALLAAGDQHPRAAIIGPQLILPDGSFQPGIQPFPHPSDALLRNLALYRLSPRLGARLCLPGYWDPESARAVDWVTGAFLFVRRRAFDAIGGFDEDLWMYAEDLDLCWRARQRGWEVRYEPTGRIHHALSVATEQAFGDVDCRAERMMQATYAWLERRQGRRAALRLAAAELATVALRVAALAVLQHVRPARWSRAQRESIRAFRLHCEGARALKRPPPATP